MKSELHTAQERGHENHGWLTTYHNFSFATYFNPAREQFGCLRALNDDTLAGGSGFDLHQHNNMEIITIVLSGAIEHADSLGNIQLISEGEIQVMTAGTGIYHTEFNHSETESAQFLQLWIFPRDKGLKPRYDQISFDDRAKPGKLVKLVTPDIKQQDEALWIHQDAFISVINLSEATNYCYQVSQMGNGVFVFVLGGEISIQEKNLGKRDAIAVTDTASIEIWANGFSRVLFIEVPLK